MGRSAGLDGSRLVWTNQVDHFVDLMDLSADKGRLDAYFSGGDTRGGRGEVNPDTAANDDPIGSQKVAPSPQPPINAPSADQGPSYSG
eukprot:1979196-Pyramimonas_sp.AAC.1